MSIATPTTTSYLFGTLIANSVFFLFFSFGSTMWLAASQFFNWATAMKCKVLTTGAAREFPTVSYYLLNVFYMFFFLYVFTYSLF